MILSSLPTILPSIFSSLASQITEVPRQKQRTRSRVARTPESFSFSLLHYSLFPAADKDTSTQRPRRKKERRDHAKRIPDERRGWICVSSYTNIYLHVYVLSCIYICIYLCVYVCVCMYAYIRVCIRFSRCQHPPSTC